MYVSSYLIHLELHFQQQYHLLLILSGCYLDEVHLDYYYHSIFFLQILMFFLVCNCLLLLFFLMFLYRIMLYILLELPLLLNMLFLFHFHILEGLSMYFSNYFLHLVLQDLQNYVHLLLVVLVHHLDVCHLDFRHHSILFLHYMSFFLFRMYLLLLFFLLNLYCMMLHILLVLLLLLYILFLFHFHILEDLSMYISNHLQNLMFLLHLY